MTNLNESKLDESCENSEAERGAACSNRKAEALLVGEGLCRERRGEAWLLLREGWLETQLYWLSERHMPGPAFILEKPRRPVPPHSL